MQEVITYYLMLTAYTYFEVGESFWREIWSNFPFVSRTRWKGLIFISCMFFIGEYCLQLMDSRMLENKMISSEYMAKKQVGRERERKRLVKVAVYMF